MKSYKYYTARPWRLWLGKLVMGDAWYILLQDEWERKQLDDGATVVRSYIIEEKPSVH